MSRGRERQRDGGGEGGEGGADKLEAKSMFSPGRHKAAAD